MGNPITNVVIPDSVTIIEDSAFRQSDIENLKIGNSVETIGELAFDENRLTSVEIPDSVITIGETAFARNQIKNLKLGKSIKVIEGGAFVHNKIETLIIPDSVTTIEKDAFYNNQIKELTLGNSLETIGFRAFYQNNISRLNIPKTGIEIDEKAFEKQDLKYYPEENPFTLNELNIKLNGLTNQVYDIDEYVEDYGNLIKENGKLRFKKGVTKTTIKVKPIQGYNYNVDIQIYNPGKYVVEEIIPVPTVKAEKEIVPWGKDIELTDNIIDLPEGARVEDITDPAIDTKKPGNYTGKVKVTFKDGSSRVVEVPVEVEKDTKSEIKPEEKPKTEKLPDKEIKVVGNNISTDHLNLDRYLYFESPHKHERKQIEKIRFDIDDNKYIERKALPIRPGINTNKSEYPYYIFTIGDMTYIKVTEKGREPRKMDVKPYLKNERTMLPLRYVGEALNADVTWDNNSRTAYFTRDGITARIQIDGNKIELSNGRVFTMDTKPDNINGRIFVPITNVSQVFTLLMVIQLTKLNKI